MKRHYVVVALVVLLVAIIGIYAQFGKVNAKDYEVSPSKTVVCSKPYIIVNEGCCLDANDNGICDKEEIEKKPGADLIPVPYEGEICEGNTKLRCVGYNIGLDTVTLKFQSASKDLINVKRIVLTTPGCAQDFSGNAEMKYSDVQEYRIPCKMKYTSLNTDFTITTQSRLINVRNTGQIDSIGTPTEVETSGHLSGAVKAIN